jgi:transposase
LDYDWQSCFERTLTEGHKEMMQITALVEGHLPSLERPYAGTGRKPYNYYPFLRAFFGKSIFGVDSTDGFIERLNGDWNLKQICGFQKVPSKSTFSRALAHLASSGVLALAHESMVKEAYKDGWVQNISRDSTAIESRERPLKKKKPNVCREKRKAGRPKKGEVRIPTRPAGLMKKQIGQAPHEAIGELDKGCAWGCKRNSQGFTHLWKGYKLHLDVADNGMPVTAVVTAANVHDSRLAVPMEKLTEGRVQFGYSLMDTAYYAKILEEYIISRGRVPVIDRNTKEKTRTAELDPAKKRRLKIRSTAERAMSDLKDNYIPKAIYVKGHEKVSFELLVSVVCLAAVKYVQMLS